MRIFTFLLIIYFPISLIAQTSFEQHKETRDYLNFYHFAQLKNSGEFNDQNLKSGKWEEYQLQYDSANQEIDIEIVRNGFSKPLKFLTPTELIKCVSIYKNGELHNKRECFEAQYNSDNSIWWEITEEINYSSGIRDGVMKEYSLGKIFHVANYTDGFLNGSEIYYPYSETPKIEIIWKMDTVLMGKWFNDKGVLLTKKDYQNWPMISVIEFYPDGTPNLKFSAKGDAEILHGEYKIYDEQGLLKEIKSYDSGALVE